MPDRHDEPVRERSLWLDGFPGSLVARPSLEADIDVDVVIVGAGFTGLWTAYYLATHDPGLRIAVVERDIAGFGASGRNGGWASGFIAGDPSVYAQRSSDDAVLQAERATFAAISEIGRVTIDENIECGFAHDGSVTIAYSEPQRQRLVAGVAAKRARGIGEHDLRLLDPDELAAHVRSPGALAATFSPHCARVDPARLVRGLADACERRGVSIYERSPADVQSGRVRTPHGSATASMIVRATESYSVQAPGWRRRFLPLYSLMIATEPLGDAAWVELGWKEGLTIADAHHLFWLDWWLKSLQPEASLLPDHLPIIAVSSWSVHRAIGLTWWDSPAAPAVRKEAYGPGSIAIMDLPAAVDRAGIRRLQLCHFHVANRDKSWLGEFRAALADAGVTLTTLLIDDGDISHPADHKRDRDWTARWIDDAAILGAKSARVIAGKQKPSPEALALSVEGLRELARRGNAQGVRVITENWFDLLSTPVEVDHVLDKVGNELGLLADFGNWKGPSKYADLTAILPRAEDTHAKASFSGPDAMDSEDYGKCVAIAMASGYDGPYTLIYDGPDDDEWASIEIERRIVVDTLAGHGGKARLTA